MSELQPTPKTDSIHPIYTCILLLSKSFNPSASPSSSLSFRRKQTEGFCFQTLQDGSARTVAQPLHGLAQQVPDLLFRSAEWACLRLGQEEQGLALLGDAGAHGAMGENEEGNEKGGKKIGDNHPSIHGIFITL